MQSKRPYKHILKNLFHEQATEIIPLLLPEFQVTRVIDVELPELREIPVEEEPSMVMEEGMKGLAELAFPEAKIIRPLRTEFIEHSGKFERAYRAQGPHTSKPVYLVIEFQTDRDDEDLTRRLLLNHVQVDHYTKQDMAPEDRAVRVEEREEGSHVTTYAYPMVLCPFPQNIPDPIQDEFGGKIMFAFYFQTINLWEKDAREVLNKHATVSYFLLPVMNNADAALLGLAIAELAQQYQGNDVELGRHLTGLHIMLQQSDLLSEEEKLGALEHLKPFMHLIKTDTFDE